jgi:hypothetical protein
MGKAMAAARRSPQDHPGYNLAPQTISVPRQTEWTVNLGDIEEVGVADYPPLLDFVNSANPPAKEATTGNRSSFETNTGQLVRKPRRFGEK